jgi:hypothetical protein
MDGYLRLRYSILMVWTVVVRMVTSAFAAARIAISESVVISVTSGRGRPIAWRTCPGRRCVYMDLECLVQGGILNVWHPRRHRSKACRRT